MDRELKAGLLWGGGILLLALAASQGRKLDWLDNDCLLYTSPSPRDS